MAENILPEGVRFFDKNQNAPDFVLGSLVITLDDFKAFVNNNAHLLTEYQGKKQIKLQLLKSKAGKTYLNVDTFKPTEQPTQPNIPAVSEAEAVDDLPF